MSFIEAEQKSEDLIPSLSAEDINKSIHDRKLIWGKGKKTNSIVFSAKMGMKGIPVIIKTGNKSSDDDITKEHDIGLVLNRLRTIVPNYMYTYGKFNAFLDEDMIIQRGDSPFLVLEDIDGPSIKDSLYSSGIKNLTDILCIFSQLLVALEVGQREYKFTHYDLHCGNVMLRELKEEITYSVLLDNKKYTFKTKTIPVIIDYGFSTVEKDGEIISEDTRKIVDGKYVLTTSGKVLESNGIFPYMIQGVDMYRFISSCVMYARVTKLKEDIMTLFRFYGDDDPYKLTRENINDSQKEFVKKVALSRAGGYTPLQFLESLIDNYKIPCMTVEPRKEFIQVFPIGNVNKTRLLEKVEDCINHTPSYIISKYNVHLLKKYPINLEDEIYTLNKWINEHEKEMKEYDNKILTTEIKVGKDTDIINICNEISSITLGTVSDSVLIKIEKFNELTKFFNEIRLRLPFLYMMEEAGIKPDLLETFKKSNEYILYDMLIGYVTATERWCWTLNRELSVKLGD